MLKYILRIQSKRLSSLKIPTIKLNDGEHIPQFGLGTWLSEPNTVQSAVEHALDVGYRHIDCAWLYGNEPEVGRAITNKINDGTVVRKDLFITSKLWNIYHDPSDVEMALKLTLENLELDYLDLFLMHFPTGWKNIENNPFPMKDDIFEASDVDYVDTWHAMENLVPKKLATSIGVSNFNTFQINRLVGSVKNILPVTNQIEVNPYLTNEELVKTCQDLNISITAYSPLGNPSKPETRSWKNVEKHLLSDPLVLQLAKKYSKNPAQILLRFGIQRGLIMIPKSITTSRIEKNSKIFDFELEEIEVDFLKGLNFDFRIVALQPNNHHKYYPFTKNYSEQN